MSSKFKKTSLIIISICIILVLIANYIASNIAAANLDELLAQKPLKGYDIKYGSIKVNMFSLSVKLKNVKLIPDSCTTDKNNKKGTGSKNIFSLHIAELKIKNINLISVFSKKILDIDEIKLGSPVLTLYTSGETAKAMPAYAKKRSESFNLNKIAINGIGGVEIKKISFEKFSLLAINSITGDTLLNTKGDICTVDNIDLLQNETDPENFRLLYKELQFEAKGQSIKLGSGKYILGFNNLYINIKERRLQINEIKFVPTQDPYQMAAHFKYRADVFDAGIKQLNIKLGDIPKMINTGYILIDSIEIDKLGLSILRNKTLPFDKNKRPLLPNELLKQLKTGINISSIHINNSKLLYEESNSENEAPMKVSLNELKININRLTSIKDSISSGLPMTIGLDAHLENQIPMHVDFEFPLNSPSDTFNYAGRLGRGDLSLFNPILKSAANISFRSGKLNGINFKIAANSHYATGKMTMLYNDLEGEILKKPREESKKLFSWLANQVIRQNNPQEGKAARTVNIYFERSMYKGFGNFSFKPLLSGILATTVPGFDSRNQKKIEAINKKSLKKDQQRRTQRKKHK